MRAASAPAAGTRVRRTSTDAPWGTWPKLRKAFLCFGRFSDPFAFAPAPLAVTNAVIGAPARPPRVALRGPATHPPRPSISSHRTKTTSMSTTFSGSDRYSWSKTAKSRGPPAALGSVPVDASGGIATFAACRIS